MKSEMLTKAETVAELIHKDQYRKNGITPYIEHPKAVVELLEKIGIADEDILCSAWLHDILEDSDTPVSFIEKEFNSNIAEIVKTLTRDCSREEYKKRLKKAEYPAQIVKLADVVHNCTTLNQITDQAKREKAVQNKIDDCKEIYLPLAEKICPDFYDMISNSLGIG